MLAAHLKCSCSIGHRDRLEDYPKACLKNVASAILADVEPGFQPGGRDLGAATDAIIPTVLPDGRFSGRQDAALYGRPEARRYIFRLAITAWLRLRASVLIGILCVLSPAVRADLWSTAYYAGWMQNHLPASKVDFTAVSHVIHFAVVPNANGSLNSAANSLTPANSADVLLHAHAAGSKVLVSVGGAGSQAAFRAASAPTNSPHFISNIVNFMITRGYDGVDLDWEPLDASDAAQYTNLVRRLRSALDAIQPRPLLTAAVAWQPALFASLQGQFDQINLMTYDLAGPWPGWVTWFNSPIYNGGTRFPSTGGLVPSTDGMVNDFIAAGVVPGKLGIGITFYGVVWSAGAGTTTGGAALPRQTWTTAPATTAVPYHTIMSTYYQPQRHRWDTNAQAAFLSIDEPGSANDKFISFDDERACQSKVSYARNRGLGGVMIWELGSGYRNTQPEGHREPLLQAVKEALAPPRLNAIELASNNVALSFTGLPLAQYRVQWSSNLNGNIWTTLTNSFATTGGLIRINDPVTPPARFYRVKTPP